MTEHTTSVVTEARWTLNFYRRNAAIISLFEILARTGYCIFGWMMPDAANQGTSRLDQSIANRDQRELGGVLRP